MVCPVCNHTNANDSSQCEKCATPLPSSDQTLGTDMGKGWSAPADDVVVAEATRKPLAPGTMLGTRYEILRMLGQGGMGVVYQAQDRELNRTVALKVIRGDMTANPEVLKRFKLELILARQITHRNVIRIFDLGQASGFKFITMEYIEGEDLQSLLKRKKKLMPGEAANIIAQVCRALEAAHAEGVVHRDLKPQNIMLDKTGRAYVMDFGIARTTVGTRMTQTGALVGTPDYMSPEQAKGLPLDARSDLFAVGIIFYEMLSGVQPFEADTTMGKLWKRTSEAARPLKELDKTIPAELGEIVRKCLEIEPQKRFANATEVLEQIESWQGPGAGTRLGIKSLAAPPAYWKWAVAGLIVAVTLAGLWVRWKMSPEPAAPHALMSVLIADFENKTGESVFDGTLEPILGIALEGAPFISCFDRGEARKTAETLKPGTARMEAGPTQAVAQREGVNVVLTGNISKEGGGYRVQAAALDAATGKTLAQEQEQTPSKQGVLAAAAKLALEMRTALGETSARAAEKGVEEMFSATSLEGAHALARGLDLRQAGKEKEALVAFGQAVEHDPGNGRAYAALAETEAELGQRQEAEKSYQAAIARIDWMTEREKLRTYGNYYFLTRNLPKAVEELGALVKQYPADTAGHAKLALAYFYGRDMPKAYEEQKRAVEILPHNLQQRSNLSRCALYAGDFEAAEKEAEGLLKENPNLEEAVRILALAELGQGHTDEAQKEYSRLLGLSPHAAALASDGLADLALYEGRLGDAMEILRKANTNRLFEEKDDLAASAEATLAQTQLALNKKGEALATAGKAAATNNGESTLYVAAKVFLAAGQEERAMQAAVALRAQERGEAQSYARLIEGETQLKRGNAQQALKIFQEAQNLSDTWLGRLDLGRAYLDAGAFPEASSEFDVCLKRRGEASSVFLNDIPTFHFLPDVYYYQGRAREGLKSPGAKESYMTFLEIKKKGAGDPLAADAARRLAGLQ